MKHIAYISTAIKLLADAELLEILRTARTNNLEHHITGVLLYSGGTFIQALEGGPEDVDKIFAAIEKDNRHKNVLKLIDEPLSERSFPDWEMGFAAIDPDSAKEIAGFLSSTDELSNSNSERNVISVLKTFIATNNLMIEH
ncbi:MAG: BLUF domain-containing protein [Mucilaginibacter sp.]